jgi:murein DD-endopeptidase MepM/ murein hydrolase activator NlpD
MKHLNDYKKQSNANIAILASGLLILGAFLYLVLPTIDSNLVHAQSVSELQNKIKEKDADIAKLEQEIRTYQNQLNSLETEKNSLSKSVQELNLNRKKLLTDISVTQKKIDRTNLTIESLGSDINGKEHSIGNNVASIQLEIRKINEFEQNTLLETLLSGQDFTVVWNDIDNIISVREKIRENLNQLKQVKGELEGTRDKTISAKDELVFLRSELSDQEKIVKQNANEKEALLKQTKNSEANYQILIKDRVSKRDAFERELQDFESQLKFILDPSKLPGGGVLAWPLDSIFVTSHYGPRWGRFHRGVDFRASIGTPVKSMSAGVVSGVGDTDVCCPGASLGKWIFIEYDNGLSSTFGHLSLTKAREGQRVTRGEVVGYSGNSGSSTGPHLHVSVYVSSGVKVGSFASKSYPGRTLTQPISATNAYLEPMFYLPPLQ